MTAASFTASTVRSNVSDTSNSPSQAMTLTEMTPLKSCGGVPEKVAVSASNVGQSGSASPFACVAASVSSALSTSAKASVGSVKLTSWSSSHGPCAKSSTEGPRRERGP